MAGDGRSDGLFECGMSLMRPVVWSVQQQRTIRDRRELIADALGYAPTTILDIEDGNIFR
jgi:hypothetical protein